MQNTTSLLGRGFPPQATSQNQLIGDNRDLESFLTDENGRSYLVDVDAEDFDMDDSTPFDAVPSPTPSTLTLDSLPLPEVVKLTLTGLRSMINAHRSLESAEIVRVQVWKEQTGSLVHRFVLLELCRPRRKTIWLRLDRRRRGPGFRNLSQAFNKGLGELAYLAANRRKLLGSSVLEYQNAQKSLEPPTLGMLQHLLRIICEELPKSQDPQLDAWLFCALLQQNLERAGEKEGQPTIITRTMKTRAVFEQVNDRLQLLRPFKPSSLASMASPTVAIPGVLVLSVKDFCRGHLFAANGLFAAEAHITVLKRYKYRRGFKHEFIIASAKTGESAEFWVRIDRAVALSAPDASITALSSAAPAKDSIRIAATEAELVQKPVDVLPRSTVLFAADRLVSRQPTLRDLAQVVGAINSVSPNYNLLKENCYFVASIIQDALTEMFAGALKGDPPTWARRHATSAAVDILRRLQGQG